MMNTLYLLAAEEGEVHHDNGVHLAGDIKEVIWGSIAFFVVLGLILWKALPAIRQAMEDRTARIEGELAEAKSRREAAETALRSSTSELPDLSEEEARIRAEANETAARLKADLIAKAEAEADSVRERGKADVANRKRQARADLSSEISEATRQAAEVMVKDQLDGSAQADLIESYINEVSRMS